jgi:RhoGEF domain
MNRELPVRKPKGLQEAPLTRQLDRNRPPTPLNLAASTNDKDETNDVESVATIVGGDINLDLDELERIRSTQSSTLSVDRFSSSVSLSGLELQSKAIAELISTEQAYLQHLYRLINLYSFPLKKMEPLETTGSVKASAQSLGISIPCLSLQEVYLQFSPLPELSLWEHERLFNNVEELLPLHILLLSQLHQQASSISNLKARGEVDTALFGNKIGDVFNQVAPFFKMYAKYCFGQFSAQQDLQLLIKARPDFCKFVNAMEAHPLSLGQKLSSLLVMPIQRVPRYVLLLSQLEKYSTHSHLPRNSLTKAVELVRGVASSLGESLARFQNQAKVSDIQASLVPPPEPTLVASHREFVLSGELEKVCKFNRKKMYFCVLLSDVFLYASTLATLGGRQTYKLHHLITLVGIDSHVDSNPFAFVLYGKEKSCIFQASTATEKGNWVSAITHCIQSQEQARTSKGLVPFSITRDAAPLQYAITIGKRDNSLDQLASCHICRKKKTTKENKVGICNICERAVCESTPCKVLGPFTPAILACFDQMRQEHVKNSSIHNQEPKRMSKKDSKRFSENTGVCAHCFSSAKERAKVVKPMDQTIIGGICLDELLSQQSIEEKPDSSAPTSNFTLPPRQHENEQDTRLSIPGGPIWEPPEDDSTNNDDPFGMR